MSYQGYRLAILLIIIITELNYMTPNRNFIPISDFHNFFHEFMF